MGTKALDTTHESQLLNMEHSYTQARSHLARKEAELFKLRKRPLSIDEIKARKRAKERQEKEDAKEQWKKITYRKGVLEEYLRNVLMTRDEKRETLMYNAMCKAEEEMEQREAEADK